LKESDYAAEVPCNYCRVFKSRDLELCRQCGIYQRRMASISGWLGKEKETGVGNTLPVLNLAIQQLVGLLRRQGVNKEQIDQLVINLVQDALLDVPRK